MPIQYIFGTIQALRPIFDLSAFIIVVSLRADIYNPSGGIIKMKKLIVLVLAIVMCLSLVACGGGPDLEAASEAYTKASTAFNEVAVVMNENIDAFGEEEIDFMTEMAGALEEVKAELESGDATQEQADEAVEWFEDVYERMEAIKEAYGIE